MGEMGDTPFSKLGPVYLTPISPNSPVSQKEGVKKLYISPPSWLKSFAPTGRKGADSQRANPL